MAKVTEELNFSSHWTVMNLNLGGPRRLVATVLGGAALGPKELAWFESHYCRLLW